MKPESQELEPSLWISNSQDAGTVPANSWSNATPPTDAAPALAAT